MASAATIQQLIDYYSNLLIIQYNNKPKAAATIALLAKMMVMNGVAIDVLNGYNIDDAVGKQLDVLGKYIGPDRFFRDTTIINFFGLTDYTEIDPDADQKFGFETYSTWNNPNPGNGTLTYDSIISLNNKLLDDSYRTLLKLAILRNTMNFSHAAIDAALYQIFGTTIWAESNGGMHMAFMVQTPTTDLIKAIIYKKLLPKPMTVGAVIVANLKPLTFGLGSYSSDPTPYEYGFSDYANFDSLTGAVITYDQLFTE